MDGDLWRVEATHVAEIAPGETPPSEEKVAVESNLEHEHATDALGLLEVAEIAVAASGELNAHFQRMTALSVALGRAVSEKAGNPAAGPDDSTGKDAVDALAVDLAAYGKSITPELDIFRRCTSEILKSMHDISTLFFDEQTGRQEEIEVSV